jgi:hypothetical protein
VAEPWSRDFDALAERSRHGLRPLDAFSPRPKETKMRFFKAHPALAALFTVLAIGLVSGAAYAVVKEVWVTVDPNKPADEIAHDIQSQLQQQGVEADVQTTKTASGQAKIVIRAQGQDPANEPNIHLSVPAGVHSDEHRRTVRVKDQAESVDADAIAAIMSSEDVNALLADGSASDADVIARLKQEFANHGYHDVTITVDGGTIDIKINAPPTP